MTNAVSGFKKIGISPLDSRVFKDEDFLNHREREKVWKFVELKIRVECEKLDFYHSFS